jgi:hypothetical protein
MALEFVYEFDRGSLLKGYSDVVDVVMVVIGCEGEKQGQQARDVLFLYTPLSPWTINYPIATAPASPAWDIFALPTKTSPSCYVLSLGDSAILRSSLSCFIFVRRLLVPGVRTKPHGHCFMKPYAAICIISALPPRHLFPGCVPSLNGSAVLRYYLSCRASPWIFIAN